MTERPTGAGPITRAYGSFEKVNQQNLLSVTSVPQAAPPGEPSGQTMAGSYSFQLNTNHLRVQECSGSPTAGLCRGWKQFVFANDGTKGGNPNPDPSPSRLYVEYWLLHYNPDPGQGQPCPSGWTEVADDGEVHCTRKSDAVELPYLSIQSIARPALRLDGATTTTADGQETDTATFNDGSGRIYSSTGVGVLHVLPPAPQEPASEWTQVEFNVFGYGHGATARFNPEASFNVRTTVEDGSPVKPGCQNFGFSSERNNLNFGPPGPVPSTPAPAVVINESVMGPAAPSACRVAAVIGDTHQYTFGGLFYDFQATGDFVEAQAGSTFEVQTRKASGAPNWPNTSVNRSVAMRMGTSRLALCEGTRLVVNGTTTSLPAGDSLLLPNGVAIDRVNNVYTFTDPSGNSVRATANSGYLDLGVGVGPGASTVRGLLGNPNDDPHYLDVRGGNPLRVPVTHTALYETFGNSWRVSPSATLLQPCTAVTPGNPTAPFYAGNLSTATRAWAQEACRNRQVNTLWLDTCTLDVGVFGSASAAIVYVGLQRPDVDANPQQPPVCVPGVPVCPTPTCSPAGCGRAGG
ncbi:VWD domain-containing protein [Micromonospora sp. WMMD975]|uniref:VWD domain-containing protein n=1 Tax=Micromonospora sp. WMMD975 TaxID=3016087 RepID=UPI00249BBF51|nr:VWD domain-containing protein [Micromonospora sp. WMMD975]WFE36372.1 hypothetical protein O7613_13575 [Micromonospora sp. WMMD975]